MTISLPGPSQRRTVTLARPSFRPLGIIVTLRGSPGTARFRLTDGTCVVGSAASSDIVIHDPAVSRSHLEIGLTTQGVSVQDLDSRNGTFYNGHRVERMIIQPRATLTLGSASLVIEPDLGDVGGVPFTGSEYRGLIGASTAMRDLCALLKRLEGTRVSLHITGESGVGKELVARALHDGSGVTGPLIALNCGAIPRELVASELFGHRKGAFTGASESRRGAFESAAGGTLFLDEIGELPLDLQPMLLRALETGEIRAVGGDRIEKVGVRVISATHRDLERDVREGRFREDLYYRLAIIKIRVPSLGERIDDIDLLATEFARMNGTTLSEEDLAELRSRGWPGNVRELKNAVQAHAVLQTLPPSSSHRDLPTEDAIGTFMRSLNVDRPYAELKDELLALFQQAYLAQLVARYAGNQSAAAKASGIERTYLGRLLAKHGITRK